MGGRFLLEEKPITLGLIIFTFFCFIFLGTKTQALTYCVGCNSATAATCSGADPANPAADGCDTANVCTAGTNSVVCPTIADALDCIDDNDDTNATITIAQNPTMPLTPYTGPGSSNPINNTATMAAQTINILGGFNSTCTTRTVNALNTTINAPGGQRVFDIDSVTSTLNITIDGVTIQNGDPASGIGGGIRAQSSGAAGSLNFTSTNNTYNTNNAPSDGGGLGVSAGPGSATALIDSNTFINNSADAGGGVGVLNLAGNLTLTGNTFTDNSATNDGGGFATLFTGAPPIPLNNATLTNNTFTNNTAGGDGGGAIVDADVNITAMDNDFTDNTAGGEGGGLVAGSPDDANVSNNTFTNNLTNGSGGGLLLVVLDDATLDANEFDSNTADVNGGGASVDADGDVNAMGNTFAGNSAGGEGAGLFIVAQNVTLDANEFDSNIALAYGGGLHASVTNNAILTNHIFINNSSEVNGGGSDITAGNTTLTNNTFTMNSTLGDGGGLNLNISDVTSASIFNNIIFNNSATGDGGDIFIDDDFNNNLMGSTVNLSNNDFSDFFSVCENTVGCTPNVNQGSNNINTDPLFVNAPAGDVNLTANSPAIDLGSPTAPNLPATDFDGNPRIFGPAPDMGALEFTGSSTIDVTIVKSSDLIEVTEKKTVEITYTIILVNTGTQSATNITVQEPLPSGATLVGASAGCTENVVLGIVTCDVGTIGSGIQQTLTITISISPRGEEILNQAILRFLGAGGVTVEKNSNTVVITIKNAPSGCSLASGAAKPGTTAANILILLIPGLLFGIRALRRKD